MKYGLAIGLLLGVVAPVISNAALIDGFETGFAGWETLGDASIQTAALGTGPTQGSNQAWLTTNEGSCPGAPECDTPYSATGAVEGAFNSTATRAFLGFPYADGCPRPGAPGCSRELNAFLFGSEHGTSGIRRLVSGAAGDAIEFDWNLVTLDVVDLAAVFLWSTSGDVHSMEYLITPDTGLFGPNPPLGSSGVNLCSHERPSLCSLPAHSVAHETGYLTSSILFPSAGEFFLAFVISEPVDSLVSGALAIDNVRIRPVPEPSGAALSAMSLFAALLIAGAATMRRPQKSR